MDGRQEVGIEYSIDIHSEQLPQLNLIKTTQVRVLQHMHSAAHLICT